MMSVERENILTSNFQRKRMGHIPREVDMATWVRGCNVFRSDLRTRRSRLAILPKVHAVAQTPKKSHALDSLDDTPLPL
jgi:hypothetical protein